MSEKIQDKAKSLKRDAQEEVDNLKSSYEHGTLGEHVKGQVKGAYRENMPEALGGRPATLAEKAKKEIVKNRLEATAEGTKEQMENNMS
jgi:hypothetical protein